MNVDDIVSEIKQREDIPAYWDFKDNDKRNHVHSMIKYPAVMVPNMQGEIFDILLKYDSTISMVLDPFMGSGTILVEGLLRDLHVYGIDINPLSFLTAQVKIHRYNIELLQKKSSDLVARIKQDSDNTLFTFDNIDKWYNSSIILQLSKIRRAIIAEPELKYRKLFWVTFAEIAKQADNSRTSTFKLHIKEKETIDNWNYDCIERFTCKLLDNITALKDFSSLMQGKRYNASIKYGDSLKILADKRIFKPNSIDLVITSPPYGDNATTITYGQYSVLPLKWIPIEDIDKNVLPDTIKTLSKIDNDSLGGSKYKAIDTVASELFKYSTSFSNVYKSLMDNMQIEKSRKVASFFIDIDSLINLLHTVVKPKKFMVFTVGNRQVNKSEVPFDGILSEIAEHYGFSLVYDFRRNILKNKNYVDTKAQNFKTIKKETVIVLQKK